MDKPIVFVLDPYHPDAIQHLQDSPSVDVVIRKDSPSRDWHHDATGVMIRSESRMTATDLAQARKLKVVVKQGVGVDNIDLEAARQHGVAVCNTPALNSEAVAELTISLALAVARRVSEIDRRIRLGEVVVRSQTLGQSLFGKTVGIVGMGNIGKVVAEKWKGAMRGEVVAYDPFAPKEAWVGGVPHQRVGELDEVLEAADVISLHVPLTNGTKGMISKPQFEKMKGNAILVNCSRGGIVDEAALVDALRSKRIFGAALDAFEVEPPTLEAYGDLLSNANVIVTPHVGASTMENQSRSGVAVAETVVAVLEGKTVPNRLV